MPLSTDTINKVFDKASVHKGDLIRAKHVTWDEPRNGIVTAVSDNKLTVLFFCQDWGTSQNYFTILASEVETGKWTVRWTTGHGDPSILKARAGDEQ